jgi:pimeloyl-ACP methyl ester carboxylesterase
VDTDRRGTQRVVDEKCVLVEGDWTHRFVHANGSRFHVVEAGSGPLILLLHGFPEFWWAWRHLLPTLAEAGFRGAAMDLRGYGQSDKTPRGYDPLTLAADVAGVIRSLGEERAHVVGQGWGGYIAWAVAAGHGDHVRSLVAVSAPHPQELLGSPRHLVRRAPLTHILAMQVPWLPERRIMRGAYLRRHLSGWAAPGSDFPDATDVDTYREALARWPSPHCALEYHRWLFRSRLRADGRAFARVMRRPITAPVLQVVGDQDPAVHAAAVAASRRHVLGTYEEVWLPGVGHFPHEERPAMFSTTLTAWLSDRASAGVDA